MNASRLTKGSRNVSVALIILAYYITQSYVPIAAAATRRVGGVPPQYWEVAVVYWLLFGTILRRPGFLLAACITLAALGGVMGILLYHSLSLSSVLLALSHPGMARNMFLFVILPVMFFSLTFDPFGLVKDLPAISGAAPAYLLLLLSSGEMLKARSAELTEHLQIRGLDLRRPRLRIRYAHVFLPPLLRASIQEAAYRHSYSEMLGCGHDRFPVRKRGDRVSSAQKLAAAAIAVLVILRLAYELLSAVGG